MQLFESGKKLERKYGEAKIFWCCLHFPKCTCLHPFVAGRGAWLLLIQREPSKKHVIVGKKKKKKKHFVKMLSSISQRDITGTQLVTVLTQTERGGGGVIVVSTLLFYFPPV